MLKAPTLGRVAVLFGGWFVAHVEWGFSKQASFCEVGFFLCVRVGGKQTKTNPQEQKE